MANDHDAPRHPGDAANARRGRHDIVDSEQTFFWPEAEDLLSDDMSDLPRAGDYRLSGVSDPFGDTGGAHDWPAHDQWSPPQPGELAPGGHPGGPAQLFEPRQSNEPPAGRPASGFFAERSASPDAPPPGRGGGLFPPRGRSAEPASPSPHPDPWSVPDQIHSQSRSQPPPPPPTAVPGPADPTAALDLRSSTPAHPPPPDPTPPPAAPAHYASPAQYASPAEYASPAPSGYAPQPVQPTQEPYPGGGAAGGYGQPLRSEAPGGYGDAQVDQSLYQQPDPFPGAGSAPSFSVEANPTVIDSWSPAVGGDPALAPDGTQYGSAGSTTTPLSYLERSTVVDPQQGVPAGSTFDGGQGDWQDYAPRGYEQGYSQPYAAADQTVVHQPTSYYPEASEAQGGLGRGLLSDHTDPSMPYPVARQAPVGPQYAEHEPGALATLLDVSDRPWFTAAVTGGLAVVLAGIVWVAFTYGNSDDGASNILSDETTIDGDTTSSVNESSAGAATTPTSSAGDESSSASIRGTGTSGPGTSGGDGDDEDSTPTSEDLVEVPSVYGYGRVIATDLLREHGLETKVTERKVPVGSGQNALVIDQSPAAGTEVEPGAVVEIFVAQESSNNN